MGEKLTVNNAKVGMWVECVDDKCLPPCEAREQANLGRVVQITELCSKDSRGRFINFFKDSDGWYHVYDNFVKYEEEKKVEKFKVGDIVVGNEKASIRYHTTYKGSKLQVVSISGNEMIGELVGYVPKSQKDSADKSFIGQTYPVACECFDLFVDLSTPFNVGDIIVGKASASREYGITVAGTTLRVTKVGGTYFEADLLSTSNPKHKQQIGTNFTYLESKYFERTTEKSVGFHKFKVGDVVVGNKEADKHYSLTTKGYVGTVISLEACEAMVIKGDFGEDRVYEFAFDLVPEEVVITVIKQGRTVTAKQVDSKGKVIATGVAKCNPIDDFDLQVGAELAVFRLNKEADAEKIAVGDTVKIIDPAYSYATYTDFITMVAPEFQGNYRSVDGVCAEMNTKYVVKAIHQHLSGKAILAIIQNPKTTQVFIINVRGIKKVH